MMQQQHGPNDGENAQLAEMTLGLDTPVKDTIEPLDNFLRIIAPSARRAEVKHWHGLSFM
jgi:hypothetical protein